MFRSQGALLITVYLLAGCVVLLAARSVYLYYERPVDPWAQDVGPTTRPDPAERTPSAARVVPRSVQLRAAQRIEELQEQLRRTQELLRDRTTLLHQKTSEQQALQAELDASIAFVFSVLAQDPPAAAADAESVQRLKASLESELTRFRTQLDLSEDLQRQQAEQVGRLQTELALAQMQLSELQLAADQEVISLQQQRLELQTASREAIRAIGTAAVPGLTRLLVDTRPHIRAWAAAALGELGMDAQDAVPFLIELLTDSDPAVAEQARGALARIES